MEFIRSLFEKGNKFCEPYLGKVVEFLKNFFNSNEYFIIGLILVFIAIILLIGLFKFLFKTPKLFFTLLIIVGIVVGLWFLSK